MRVEKESLLQGKWTQSGKGQKRAASSRLPEDAFLRAPLTGDLA